MINVHFYHKKNSKHKKKATDMY